MKKGKVLGIDIGGSGVKGGIVDTERVHKMFLIELRGMKIGAMSYERPST